VSDLVINADYDLEDYQDLLQESGCWQRVVNAGGDVLPQVVCESVHTAEQKLYDELTDRQCAKTNFFEFYRPNRPIVLFVGFLGLCRWIPEPIFGQIVKDQERPAGQIVFALPLLVLALLA
jgi:hypothetical protein